MVKPWPLQSFLPLQSWVPPLQAPFPLQSFAPSQWTAFAALPLPAKATAGAIIVASAPAIATPFIVPFFILRTSCWYSAFCRSHVRRPRRNGRSPSHAAGCRARSITPERVIVFQPNGAPNASRQLGSTREWMHSTRPGSASFAMPPDTFLPENGACVAVAWRPRRRGSWLVELALLRPDDGAERFFFEAADSTSVRCMRSSDPALPRSEYDGASPPGGKWRSPPVLGVRALKAQ